MYLYYTTFGNVSDGTLLNVTRMVRLRGVVRVNSSALVYITVKMDRIDIESSEIEAAELVEHDDTEERGAMSVVWFQKIRRRPNNHFMRVLSG